MSKRPLITGIVILLIGAAVGSAVTWAIMRAAEPDNPFGMSDEAYEAAQRRAGLLKSATLLRGVAQAMYMKHKQESEWSLPHDELALIAELIDGEYLSPDVLDDWPGGENRRVGEPPFYVVGTIEGVANLDADVVLLYEHPAHHPEGGGSIAYADTHVETLEPDAFRARIRDLQAGGR
jgi:hypothetical protein